MALVNGGYLHCTDIKKFLLGLPRKQPPKKLAMVLSKIQVSDPGPYWYSYLFYQIPVQISIV